METRNSFRLSAARCSAIALIVFAILALSPFPLLQGIFTLIAIASSKTNWSSWHCAGLACYILGLIESICALIAFAGLLVYGIVLIIFHKHTPILDSPILAIILGPCGVLLIILQITFSCRSFYHCRYLYDTSSAVDNSQVMLPSAPIQVPVEVQPQAQYLQPAPYQPNYPPAAAPGYYPPQDQIYYAPQNQGYAVVPNPNVAYGNEYNAGGYPPQQ